VQKFVATNKRPHGNSEDDIHAGSYFTEARRGC